MKMSQSGYGADLGALLTSVEEAMDSLDRGRVIQRIWEGDHTIWKPDPREISDRLGWLTISRRMRAEVPALEAFAREALDAGFRHVVLLGMGGSSLGTEVLRQTFGSSAGYPELIVLDSTVPAWVQSVTDAVDPARTLYLVSSKSGGTVEALSFYAHFRSLVEKASGETAGGGSFVAITDPGTPLEALARERGFRRIFLNPADVGGRYSVLSYFGLVPAALMGIDISSLLDAADRMADSSGLGAPARDNPGAWLGAVMGTFALQGRDKLTLVTSPAITGFGLWVEQLIAESTGKEGKGIIPIATEPQVPAGTYGKDRLFVYMRLGSDDNGRTDSAMDGFRSSGYPVARLDLETGLDLGAEFFRWEFATAVAGSLVGINPFDQPDVQGAKDMTDSVLEAYRATGQLPDVQCNVSPAELLSQAREGDYLAVTPYLRQTADLDAALEELRRLAMVRLGIPATLSYGPRYLHSTGQLHKGGPGRGLHLQLTGTHPRDIPIPGQPYTFGVLADAQALGDLQALQALGRRVARLHLGSTPEAGVRTMVRELKDALG